MISSGITLMVWFLSSTSCTDRSSMSTRHGAIWRAFKAGNGPLNEQRNTRHGHNLRYKRLGTFCSQWVWLTLRRWNWEPRAMSQRVQHGQTAEDISRAHPPILGNNVFLEKKRKKERSCSIQMRKKWKQATKMKEDSSKTEDQRMNGW